MKVRIWIEENKIKCCSQMCLDKTEGGGNNGNY